MNKLYVSAEIQSPIHNLKFIIYHPKFRAKKLRPADVRGSTIRVPNQIQASRDSHNCNTTMDNYIEFYSSSRQELIH
jgi:hypothetical protein